MALNSATLFNPLLLSAGNKLGWKNVTADTSLRCPTSSSSFSRFQLGLVARRLTGPRQTMKSRRGRRSSSCGMRRLTVFAVENERSSSESESGGQDMDALESRLGLGRRARRQQQSGSERSERKPGATVGSASSKAKTWEKMSLPEKAWSVYIDPKKGVLFWLNKLAYAAIFLIIGGWITFRFIGPALGWYQLDQPPLAPDKLFNSGP